MSSITHATVRMRRWSQPHFAPLHQAQVPFRPASPGVTEKPIAFHDQIREDLWLKINSIRGTSHGQSHLDTALPSATRPPSALTAWVAKKAVRSAEDQAEPLVHVSLGTSYATFLTFPDSEMTSGAFPGTNPTQWSDMGAPSLPKYVS